MFACFRWWLLVCHLHHLFQLGIEDDNHDSCSCSCQRSRGGRRQQQLQAQPTPTEVGRRVTSAIHHHHHKWKTQRGVYRCAFLPVFYTVRRDPPRCPVPSVFGAVRMTFAWFVYDWSFARKGSPDRYWDQRCPPPWHLLPICPRNRAVCSILRTASCMLFSTRDEGALRGLVAPLIILHRP